MAIGSDWVNLLTLISITSTVIIKYNLLNELLMCGISVYFYVLNKRFLLHVILIHERL